MHSLGIRRKINNKKRSHTINGKGITLDPIQEEIDRNNFKENFSNLKRNINTKIIGGGPLYPVPA
jgi:hypothetical protein